RSLLYRDGIKVVHVKYEDLIADPERELRRVTAFLGVPFEAAMLDYGSRKHDYPAWEAGSTDVSRNERISGDSASKWRRAKMTTEMLHALMKYDPALIDFGYPASGLAPTPAHRFLADLFPLVSPFLEAASRLKRMLRPLAKNRARLWACAGLALLAVQFLIPGSWLPVSGLAADGYQPVLCLAATLGFAAVFGPVLLRRATGLHPLAETLLKASAGMAGAIGLLEAGQNFVPGRHASVNDFLFNLGGVLLGILLATPFISKTASPAPKSHAGAQATALTA
ncbi:MAG TPA: sulfotransferase, partial [Micropepsaceae bacterium]|nr:sulfotransferase [Micropepsaceae bacterium]